MRARRLAVLLVAVLVAAARPAAAVSIFGEVITQDPTAIRPGEQFTIEVTLALEGNLVSLFEGRFLVVGATIEEDPVIRFGFDGVSALWTVLGQRVLVSQTANQTGEPIVKLFDLFLVASSARESVRIEMLGDESGFFAQKDCAGICDVFRITERVPLPLRSGSISLGISLTIIPEPATAVLLLVGLGFAAALRLRRRASVRAVLFLGVAGWASSASAVSLFGEVIAEDPRAIRPGEMFEVVVTVDTEGKEIALFEGRFESVGANVEGASTFFGLQCFCCFGCPVVNDNRVLVSFSFENTRGVLRLLGLDLRATRGSAVSVFILGDEADLFAQRDTVTGVEDVLRISERIPLELRSQGVSLGTSLTIIPEPAPLVLLLVALAIGAALGRGRRAAVRGLLVLGIVGSASSASAVSLFGEVIAQDPRAIRPGERFAIELAIDLDGDEMSLFEGRFRVLGATLDPTILEGFPRIRFGIPGRTSFVNVVDSKVLASLTLTNTPGGVVNLLDFPLVAGAAGGSIGVDVLGDEAWTFAAKDCANCPSVLIISERVPLELRSQGTSLGTSLPIVPEPATLLLLGMGLAGLAIERRRGAST